MSGKREPSIVPFGEAALLVRLAERIDPLLNARVHLLAQRVRAARDAGDARLGIPVPGYASLLVPFDAQVSDGADVAAWLDVQLRELPHSNAGRASEPIDIPVRYGGAEGPDLDDVARRTGLSTDAVVGLHGSVVYRVYMLGFAPGFAYLGELPAPLELPRRETPRQRVPAGSVAIAARQTAVYPLPTPGGWHLIGRTDAPLWDPLREQPALLQAGDRVRFVAG